MRYRLQSLLRLFLMTSIVSGHSFLLAGCGALVSSSPPSSIATGTHCPMTYSSTHEHAMPGHTCPMHDATADPHEKLPCTCGQHIDASNADLSAVRFMRREAPL